MGEFVKQSEFECVIEKTCEHSENLFRFTMSKQREVMDITLDATRSLSDTIKIVTEHNRILQSRVSRLETELTTLKLNECVSCASLHRPPLTRKAFVNENKCAPSSDVQRTTANDPCEVLVYGVPSLSHLHPTEIISRLLTFASLSTLIGHVASTRNWKTNSSATSKSTNTSAKRSAFVVRFSSPHIRDAFVTRIKSLKNVNTQTIFGSKYLRKINVMNLLPKHTFLLLLKARKVYKSLNCAPPIVRNGTVSLRKLNQSSYTAIYSECDLTNFKVSQPRPIK